MSESGRSKDADRFFELCFFFFETKSAVLRSVTLFGCFLNHYGFPPFGPALPCPASVRLSIHLTSPVSLKQPAFEE